MANTPTPVDFFVLGAGSGGLAAAKRAASYGAKVAIAEHSRVGGTCVIRGCIPKKLMVYAAHLGLERRLSADFGWDQAPGALSWAHLKQARDATVARLQESHTRQLKEANIEVVQGSARLHDSRTVVVGDSSWEARHILLATGSTPTMPTFPGKEHCLSSDGFFELTTMPANVVIIGGGYIAVEFASLLAELGSKVTMLVRSSLLRGFDEDLCRGVVEVLTKRGINVCEGGVIERVERDGKAYTACFRHNGEVVQCKTDTCVLFATGRTPTTRGLGLEEVGVHLADNGAIQVDNDHVTAVPHIYAVGDVLDKVNLTPMAIKAGRSLADRLFGNKHWHVSYDSVPTAVFCDPPLGTVGLTEAEARDWIGEGVQVYKARFTPLKYSFSAAEHKEFAFIKLIVDRKSDRVLGFHMLGDDAPEIIQGFAAGLQAGITKAQLDSTVAIHPTIAEEFVLMR